MAITRAQVLSALAGTIRDGRYRDAQGNDTTGKVIVLAENVATQGDCVACPVDAFVALFGSAASMAHADLSGVTHHGKDPQGNPVTTTPVESGFQAHLDRWKAEGLLI